MPAFVKVVLLAVIQALTEFLPVSSSGHLVLAKHFLQLKTEGAFLEVALHGGTLVAILVYYRKRIGSILRQVVSGRGEGRYYSGQILLATMPAIAAYFLLQPWVDELFARPLAASLFLCVTGLLLLSLRLRRSRNSDITPLRSLGMGIAQAFALIPGISRAGATIVFGRHAGLSPERSAEFSFLMAIPALAGAILVKAAQVTREGMGDVTVAALIVGVIVSGALGFAAIAVLVRTLRAGWLWAFGIYCLAMGLLAAVMLKMT